MNGDKIIRYWRFLMQGVAMASWGTMGITPSWGGFTLGLVCAILGFALVAFEKGD